MGYQNCKKYDVLNVALCRKCARHGHNTSKCRNESVCLKCADKHEISKCNGENENKCINCDYTNRKYGIHCDTKYIATDSHACKILLGKIQKLVDATDYIVMPTIPRHGGKIGNYQYQPTVKQISNLSPIAKNTSNLPPTRLMSMNQNVVAKLTGQNLTDHSNA